MGSGYSRAPSRGQTVYLRCGAATEMWSCGGSPAVVHLDMQCRRSRAHLLDGAPCTPWLPRRHMTRPAGWRLRVHVALGTRPSTVLRRASTTLLLNSFPPSSTPTPSPARSPSTQHGIAPPWRSEAGPGGKQPRVCSGVQLLVQPVPHRCGAEPAVHGPRGTGRRRRQLAVAHLVYCGSATLHPRDDPNPPHHVQGVPPCPPSDPTVVVGPFFVLPTLHLQWWSLLRRLPSSASRHQRFVHVCRGPCMTHA